MDKDIVDFAQDNMSDEEKLVAYWELLRKAAYEEDSTDIHKYTRIIRRLEVNKIKAILE